ncbi:MAG: bifunctional phosphopantothenoylcysteine decarboxylase/phosphopantothenate--cysteine ligase CoaBC [Bacteroidales bacterium]|nr:bifunctional phosphopantothenoylcysteine decarboxylase/phosphopantothenate--cysteine ligase CoaBC [Bacteroidales bacterium]
MLSGKKILVGVTGSIAAYKTAALIRLLIKEGTEVRVVMTPLAKEFITPLTLATLAKNPVLVDFWNPVNGDWNSHVDLGIWADAYLIAPASANTMAKMAAGIADNLLLTTYLSARCPVFVAPAMDLDMLNHPATRKNIEILKSYGNIILEPATGELASGLVGKGRMEEPEKLVAALKNHLAAPLKKKIFPKLKGKTVLVTAGPTYEPLDAVRFIGNYSSGKMGFAIAERLAECGAHVKLVSGPVSLKPVHHLIEFYPVKTAQEMLAICLDCFSHADGAILSAAVADYRPKSPVAHKIKRTPGNLIVELVPNPDIAAELGKIKQLNQFLAGFALETDHEIANAQQKMKKKNFDFIVLNSLQDKGSGFNSETNKITILGKNNKKIQFELKSKQEAALDIIHYLEQILR